MQSPLTAAPYAMILSRVTGSVDSTRIRGSSSGEEEKGRRKGGKETQRTISKNAMLKKRAVVPKMIVHLNMRPVQSIRRFALLRHALRHLRDMLMKRGFRTISNIPSPNPARRKRRFGRVGRQTTRHWAIYIHASRLLPVDVTTPSASRHVGLTAVVRKIEESNLATFNLKHRDMIPHLPTLLRNP